MNSAGVKLPRLEYGRTVLPHCVIVSAPSLGDNL